MKLFLFLALLCGTALAEGDMGNGGYTPCTENCPPPNCTENCRTVPVNTPISTLSNDVVIFISRFITRVLI